MSTVEQIEEAVQQLSREDLESFRRWYFEFDANAWDRKFEDDVREGKLNALADEALDDLRQGRTRPL